MGSHGEGHRWILLGIIAIVFVNFIGCNGQKEVFKASQCFKSRGIPKVAFNCEQNDMIKIQRAFHGISLRNKQLLQLENKCSPSPGHKASNCTNCEGDCVDDSMNMVYDWSTCMGNRTCLRTVMQSYMPSCPGKNKFSDYLQVEYQCIPRNDVIDICSNTQQWLSEGYLMSPNYPDHYPVNQDCLCKFQTDWNSRVVLSFYDLLLETRNGRCRADWLMLKQKGQKHRHCGAIMTGTKNVTSETNSITLQFHTDEHDNRTQNFQYFTRNLKGFWLYFRAEPDSSMQVTCRRLSSADPEVKEIYEDDTDYNEALSKSKETADGAGDMGGGGVTDPMLEGNTIMGDDATSSSKGGDEHPNATKKGPRKRPKKKEGTGEENEVYKQEGTSSAPWKTTSNAIFVATTLLLQILHIVH